MNFLKFRYIAALILVFTALPLAVDAAEFKPGYLYRDSPKAQAIKWPAVDYDPVIQERWGFLAQLAGRRFTSTHRDDVTLVVTWLEKGRSLAFNTHLSTGKPFSPLTQIFRFDELQGKVILENKSLGPKKLGANLQDDQSIFFSNGGWPTPYGTYLVPTGDGFYFHEGSFYWQFSDAGPIDVGVSAHINSSIASISEVTSQPVHRMMPINWGGIAAFIGVNLVHLEYEFTPRLEESGLVLVLDEFKVKKTPNATVLQVTQAPSGCGNPIAKIASNTSIEIECEYWNENMRYIYQADGQSLRRTVYYLNTRGLNFLHSWEFVGDFKYQVATADVRQAERERKRRQDERNRRIAQEEAIEREERQQRTAQAFGAMLGELSSYASKEVQNNETQQSFLNGLNRNLEQIEEKQQRVARSKQTQQNDRHNEEQHAIAQRTAEQPLAAQYNQTTIDAKSERQLAEKKRMGQAQKDVAKVGERMQPATVEAKRKKENEDTSQRLAYLEAVTVCTKPKGPKQSFECRNPLNVESGHADDIPGYRNPEELAKGEACPGARRLASSTHLVWGCGFAATGAINAKDRGAGIDIQGRRTYYCTEGQFSCRRTEP